jgi:hypothetical protein
VGAAAEPSEGSAGNASAVPLDLDALMNSDEDDVDIESQLDAAIVRVSGVLMRPDLLISFLHSCPCLCVLTPIVVPCAMLHETPLSRLRITAATLWNALPAAARRVPHPMNSRPLAAASISDEQAT